jgi:hypothetical protein
MRLTGVAHAETLLRLVQSVPSPKDEPIKLWLAKVGYERMQEMSDPALSLERARATWQKHGRSDKWIQQRMTGQETRNKLTDYWASHEIKKGEEYAVLTNLIHQEWSGVSVKSHKELKNLKTQMGDRDFGHNLRLSWRPRMDHRLSVLPIADIIPIQGRPPGPLEVIPWTAVFKPVHVDESGTIAFDKSHHVVRHANVPSRE